MIVVGINTSAYALGEFIPIIPSFEQYTDAISKLGFWFKPGANVEQRRQDYSQCRGTGGRACMREKDYFWLTTNYSGFWYKVGNTQEQAIQDYAECTNLRCRVPCMKQKGYTWASYYGE